MHTTVDRGTVVADEARRRDFRLLLGGQAVSSLGSHACMLAFPLVALALTGSPAMAGLLGFVAAAPGLLLAVPAGVHVDRVDRRRVMVWCDAGRFATMLAIAVAALAGALTFPVLAVCAAVHASLTVLFGLAQTAAIPSVVASAELPRAISRHHATMQGTVVAGQPLGGWLFGLAPMLPFVVNAISFLASLATLLGIRSDLSPGRPAARRGEPEAPEVTEAAAAAAAAAASWRREAAEGLRFVWRTPVLRALSVLSAGTTLLTGGFTLVVVVLLGAVGAQPGAIGLVFGLCGAAGVAGAALAPVLLRRLGGRRVFVTSIAVSALAALALTVVSTPWHVGIAAAVIVALGPPSAIVVQVARARTIPRPMFGRVHAVESTIAASTAPVAALLAGLALEGLGPAATCALVGTGLLLAAAVARATPALEGLDAESAGNIDGAPATGRHRRREPAAPTGGRHRRRPGTPCPVLTTHRAVGIG